MLKLDLPSSLDLPNSAFCDPRGGTSKRRQAHVYFDVAVRCEVDALDETEIVDFDGDLEIEDPAHQPGIIVLMLTDSPAVELAVPGEDGALDGVDSGSLLINMGTASVPLTRKLAE